MNRDALLVKLVLFIAICVSLFVVAGCQKSQNDSKPRRESNQSQDLKKTDANENSGKEVDSGKSAVTDGVAAKQADADQKVPPSKETKAEDSKTVTTEGTSTAEESKAETETAENSKPAFREELEYDKWEKPLLAIFITGGQHGYIEPCGCTGLANQKGGLLRRDTVARQLEEKGWPLVKIDAGNQIRRFGEQPRIKFSTTIESLAKVMKYDAIALGPDDLRLTAIQLFGILENNVPDPNDKPFVGANIGILEDFEFLKQVQVIERAGKKIGVIAVLGDEFHDQINNEEIAFKKTDEALAAAWPKLKEQNCDLNILIAEMSLEKSREVAEKFPHFDILISTGGAGEPTRDPALIVTGDHTTRMVQVGVKGMYVGVIGLFDDAKNPLRYQRVPLDDRYEDAEEMKTVFKQYQQQLEAAGLEGLGLKPVLHPSGATFVGSKVCADCHEHAYEIWKNGIPETGDEFGPHWHATKSLVEPNERVWVTRFHDPECLSCHSTGWNPQKYFPYQGGFLDLVKSQDLHGNGCENCHGPGSKHVAAENGETDADEDQLKALQESMRLTLEEAKESKCMECHDLDNSPDFHVEGAFEKYWRRIVHNEE